eukprot:6885999-Prymnesium_polylepis.1
MARGRAEQGDEDEDLLPPPPQVAPLTKAHFPDFAPKARLPSATPPPFPQEMSPSCQRCAP